MILTLVAGIVYAVFLIMALIVVVITGAALCAVTLALMNALYHLVVTVCAALRGLFGPEHDEPRT